MIISFVVPGNPLPWARARGKGKARYNAPEQTEYKKSIAWHAVKARNTARLSLRVEWPLDAIYAVTLIVHRKDWHCMDADRVLNNFADACQGILYDNDRHRFIRDARVIVGDPIAVEPCLGVLVQVRDANEHRDVVSAMWQTIEKVGDGVL